MRARRWTWLGVVLLAGSCLGPLRCEESSRPEDFSAGSPAFDFAIGELGRPPGNACATLDSCDRFTADNCAGTCQCGTDHPCDDGLGCCNGRCVDVLTDPQNCGGCGIACGSGQCVHGDLGDPHCTCDADGGAATCSSPFEPTCDSEGLCSCGPSSVGVCNALDADGCGCAGGAACSGPYADHCNAGHGCQCGGEAACDPKLATACDPTASDGSACRCAQGPGCSPGTFCCTQDSSCCQPNQYCCLDGCCDQPCLLLGFCGK
jgi:hypothetical protein